MCDLSSPMWKSGVSLGDPYGFSHSSFYESLMTNEIEEDEVTYLYPCESENWSSVITSGISHIMSGIDAYF